MVSTLIEISAVLHPILAVAIQASIPAWPPPITITSKEFVMYVSRETFLKLYIQKYMLL